MTEKILPTRLVWSPLFEKRVRVELGVEQLAGIVQCLRDMDESEEEPTWHSWMADQIELVSAVADCELQGQTPAVEQEEDARVAGSTARGRAPVPSRSAPAAAPASPSGVYTPTVEKARTQYNLARPGSATEFDRMIARVRAEGEAAGRAAQIEADVWAVDDAPLMGGNSRAIAIAAIREQAASL